MNERKSPCYKNGFEIIFDHETAFSADSKNCTKIPHLSRFNCPFLAFLYLTLFYIISYLSVDCPESSLERPWGLHTHHEAATTLRPCSKKFEPYFSFANIFPPAATSFWPWHNQPSHTFASFTFVSLFHLLSTTCFLTWVFLGNGQCRDSNSRPLDHQSSAITTRPGLWWFFLSTQIFLLFLFFLCPNKFLN